MKSSIEFILYSWNINTSNVSPHREASERALKGSLLEVVEEILTSAEEEAKRTGNDGDYPKGIVSSAYPDMTFDAADYQRFSKREVCSSFIFRCWLSHCVRVFFVPIASSPASSPALIKSKMAIRPYFSISTKCLQCSFCIQFSQMLTMSFAHGSSETAQLSDAVLGQ